MTWYLVLSAATNNVPRTAYPTRAHAEAVAAASNFEYPSLAPYRVVELVEAQQQELADDDAESRLNAALVSIGAEP